MVRISACAGLLLMAPLGVSASAAPEVPAAAFAALPQVSDVELSPDAQLVAWYDRSGPDAKVVIFDLAAKNYRRTLRIDPATVPRSLLWADDETLLVNLSEVRKAPVPGEPLYDYSRSLAVDVASGDSRMLLMAGGERAFVTAADLLAWHTAQPHTVIMASWDYSANAARVETGTRLVAGREAAGWVGELFQVDTRTGKGTLIDQGGPFAWQWVVDTQGAPVARSQWHPVEKKYLLEARAGKGWRTIYERDDGALLTLWEVSADGKNVVATGPGKDGRIGLWAIALDGSGMKDLLPEVTTDVLSIVSDNFSGAPVAARLGGPQPAVHWIDAAAEARYESLAHAFPGREVTISSRSQDASRLVVEVRDSSHPPVYYLVDFNTHRADIVGEAYPALDSVALGTVQSITYKARDGTSIPAYLTLPPGAAPKGLRMVVLPHDGPESSDAPEFNWLAQFLATRGYAVLQPEFRGSTGFGAAFERAGLRQWAV